MDRQYFRQNVSPKVTYANTVEHVCNIMISTIGATFGPGGTHNLFVHDRDVKSSKDGYENLQMMNFDDSTARMVHMSALEVAERQASLVGDGTTSSILLMSYLYNTLKENKELWSKFTPSQIAKAMSDLQGTIVAQLQEVAVDFIDDPEAIIDLVYTSTDRNQELTDIIMNMYHNFPGFRDTNVVLGKSNSGNTYFKVSEGMTLRGVHLMSQYFNNYDAQTCKLENVEIIVVDGKPNVNNDVIGKYFQDLRTQGKSFLIICSGMNENFVRFVEGLGQQRPEYLHNMAVVFCEANSSMKKDAYYDLVNATGCQHIEENTDITKESILELRKGFAKDVIIKDRMMTISGFNKTEEFKTYVTSIKEEIDRLTEANATCDHNEKISNTVTLGSLRARYTALTSGAVTLFVGGETQQRMAINYRLAEDGVKALQTGLNHGYLLGCNTAPMNMIYQLLICQKIGGDPELDTLYSILLKVLLESYIRVYEKLIGNRIANLDRVKLMKYIALPTVETEGTVIQTESGASTGIIYPYCPSSGEIKVDAAFQNKLVFQVQNLVADDKKVSKVINPALTDILIMEKAVDAALVLATANTIMTDKNEFEAMPD